MWSLNLHFKCNTLHLNQMYHKPTPFTSWTTISCACAFYFRSCSLLLMIVSGTSFSETVITPEEEDHRKNRVSSARQANPIGHIYKIPIPSQSRLCMIRRSLCIDSTAYLNPYPMHDLSCCHTSKQTTILADIGVVMLSCGPCNCYCLLHA